MQKLMPGVLKGKTTAELREWAREASYALADIYAEKARALTERAMFLRSRGVDELSEQGPVPYLLREAKEAEDRLDEILEALRGQSERRQS